MAPTSKHPDLIRVLDVGTSKVLAVAGRRTDAGDIELVGIGHAGVGGRKDGNIVDVEAAANAIRDAVADAAKTSGAPFDHAMVSVSGSHLLGGRAITKIAIATGSVEPRDVERLVADARSADWGQDRELILLQRIGNRVDNLAVHDPVGMSGTQLEGTFQSITALKSRVDTLRRCVSRAGVETLGLTPGAVALGTSIITPDERDLGVAIVDMGAGTTSVAIFKDHALCYFACIPLGGDRVSADIATMLRVPPRTGEQLKIIHGAALASSTDATKTFDTVGVDGQPVSGESPVRVSDAAEARVREILGFVKQCLQESQVHDLPAGLVVTGGASTLRDIGKLGRELFTCPWREARISIQGSLPAGVSAAMAATAWGMLSAAPRPTRAFTRSGGFLRRLFG